MPDNPQQPLSAEEEMLAQLKGAYQKEGLVSPRTPQEKVSAESKTVDDLLRQHHLELETQIQESLEMVTSDMSMAQAFQTMTYLAKEIENLLSGAEDSLYANKVEIEELVDNIDTKLDAQRESLSSGIAKYSTQSLLDLAMANLALLQARQLDKVHQSLKSMKKVLSDSHENSSGSPVH